jgi:hypothetical protein
MIADAYSTLVGVNQKLKLICNRYAINGYLATPDESIIGEKCVSFNKDIADKMGIFWDTEVDSQELFKFSKVARKTRISYEIKNSTVVLYNSEPEEKLKLPKLTRMPSDKFAATLANVITDERSHVQFQMLNNDLVSALTAKYGCVTVDTTDILDKKPVTITHENQQVVVTKELFPTLKKDDTLYAFFIPGKTKEFQTGITDPITTEYISIGHAVFCEINELMQIYTIIKYMNFD